MEFFFTLFHPYRRHTVDDRSAFLRSCYQTDFPIATIETEAEHPVLVAYWRIGLTNVRFSQTVASIS